MISIIKAKLSFFCTSNSEGHDFHGKKGTIFFPRSVNFPISAISTKLYFVEIGWVHQKLSIFKCTMLKSLNSDFFHWEDTLNHIDEVRIFCETHRPHVLCLNETKLSNEINDEDLQIENYHTIFRKIVTGMVVGSQFMSVIPLSLKNEKI